MRRLQHLRGSASALSTSSASAVTPGVFTSSTCRLPRELHATPKWKQLSRTSPSTTLSPSRSFTTSLVRAKTIEEPTANDQVPLQLEELEELGLRNPAADRIATDLRIPRVRGAQRPTEISDPEYTAAKTGEGLEEVGGWADFWDQPRAWPASKSYFGFKPFEPVTEPLVLEVMARRALVEALAVRKAVGQEALAESWRIGTLRSTFDAVIDVAEDGSAQLSGELEQIVDSVVGDQDSTREMPMSTRTAKALIKSWDASWKNVSLVDPWLKFAVLKRIQQLSGQVISDSRQIDMDTVGALLAELIKPPKPTKLAEVLEARGELPKLPNVTVYSRRVTPIDKEKMVGRWKVMTKELEARGLPVIGTGGYGKSVERKWAAGKA